MNPTKDLSVFPPILREFASYKLNIQGCSVKTVDEYLIDLRTFFRYLILIRQGKKPTAENMLEADIRVIDLAFIKRIVTTDIYDFLMYSGSQRGNGKRTSARKLSAIKALFKYLTVKRSLLEVNPAANIESPKQKKQLPKHLSVEESIDLLTAVQQDTDSDNRARNYAILTLFLNCGMRLSELAGISFGDLDTELRSLRVLGKGAKERVVYLNDACREALNAYLPVRQTLTPKSGDENALFISRNGNRLSIKTIQWMVKKYLGAAGLEYKHYSTHKLRHTAATLMYQTGEVDIRVLKDILGHEQLTTTQIYTHVSDRGMEEAVAKNPLSSVFIRPAEKRLSDIPEDATGEE